MKNWNYMNGAQVGNSKAGEKNVGKEGPYHIEQLTEDGNFGWYKMPKGSFVAYRNDVVYGNFKTLDEAKRKLQDEINKDKEFNRKYTTNSKTGNYKTGKSSLKPGDKVQSYGVKGTVKSVHEEFTDSIYGEPLIEVEFENGTTKKIGEHYLVKVGNSTYDMTERDYENEYKSLVQKRNNLQTGTKEYEEIQKRLEEIRKKIGRSPFGNSASDDKFAYVMREFDEGKLKTPDGKVVTDPAQAKAIAYSESKKTENGCARARNAMACNKKVGNSIYSELNKSDKRVVIEADGSWYVYDKNDKVIEQGRESNADNALGKFKAKGYNKKIGNRTPNYRYKGFLITNPEGYEYIVFLKDGVTVGYRGTTSKAQAEDWCDWHDPKTGKMIGNKVGNAMDPIKYKGYTIKFRPNSQKYYISSGPGDTYVREYAYKEYASEQDAKDAIDHLK